MLIILLLGPILTLFCYAPDKGKNYFLVACGFLDCGRFPEVDPGHGTRKGKHRVKKKGRLPPEPSPDMHVDVPANAEAGL